MPRPFIVLFSVLLAFLSIWSLSEDSTAKAAVPATMPAAAPTNPNLTGLWLVNEAPINPGFIMGTTLNLTERTFALHGYWGMKADWTGSFELGTGGHRHFFGLRSDGISYQERGLSGGIPPCRLPGIYKLDGDRLTICFAKTEADARPTEFRTDEHAYLVSFVRAPATWSGFPKTVKITVTDPQGRPDPAAILFGYINRSQPFKPAKDGKFFIDTTQPTVVTSYASQHGGEQDQKLGPDGSVVVPYSRFLDPVIPIGARDVARGWIGLGPISPGILRNGTLAIRMQPQRIVRGTIAVDGEAPPGEKPPWRAAYLTAFENRFAFCAAPDGTFEFCVPPGNYSLYAYGNELISKTQDIVVPAKDGVFVLPTIALQPSNLQSLRGKTAPELIDVKAWKNGPVSLSDFKGKVVLLDFWGCWCPSCVYYMPELFRLHDKYKDKGLVIVSVHVDDDDDVDTAAKLDERTKMYRDGIWKGRDLPFPVALCPGKNRHVSGNPVRYGVLYYPTAIFIDRHGRVLGNQHQVGVDLNYPKETDAAIEKLLAAP